MTYAYKLADCLDTMVGTTDPTSAANVASTKNCLKKVSPCEWMRVKIIHLYIYLSLSLSSLLFKPDGPAASVKQIVYGYIQQVKSSLDSQNFQPLSDFVF